MHVIKLNGYNATTENGEKLELGTFDSYGEEQLQIVEAPDWVNLSVIATFNPPNKKPVQVAVDSVTGVIKVPKEATADLYGVGTIVFVGLADGVQRISADCEYIVRKHSNASGTEPAEPTPDLLQQVLTLSKDAQTAAKNAEQSAKNAAKDAADTVKPYKEEAVRAATAAALSEKNAAESKTAAQEAAERATQAGIAASNAAEEAERSAGIATDAAGGSALNAENAHKSALAAQQSAKNAAESQSVAAASADAASKSQQSAAIDAKTAFDAKVAAAGSAEAAAGSANAAENSASAAAGSERAAETSELKAAKSEKAAKASEQAASESAQAALESKTAAATSEVNAAASAKKAQDVADSLPEDYTTAVNDIATLKQQVANITPDDSSIGDKPWSSKNIIDMLCPPLEESGNPVVCYPVAGYPLGVKASWEPMQEGSGTPYPSGGGKNLFNPAWMPEKGIDHGVTWTTTPDGTVTANGTASGTTYYNSDNFSLPAGTYTISAMSHFRISILNRDAGSATIAVQKVGQPHTFTVENDIQNASLFFAASGTLDNVSAKPQIEKGATATAYAPYENIRPIKGRDSVNVERCGENLLPFGERIENIYKQQIMSSDALLLLSKACAGKELTLTFSTETQNIVFNDDVEDEWRKRIGFECHGTLADGTEVYTLQCWFDDANDELTKNGKKTKTVTVTMPELASGSIIFYAQNIESGSFVAYDFGIYAGTTAPTTYTPYNGQTNTLTLPETVYGGEVDAVSGEGQETWQAISFDGTENWLVFDAGGTGQFFYTTKYSFDKTPIAKICSHFRNVSFAGIAIIRIYTNMFTDTSAFSSYLAAQNAAGTPVQIAYKLAEPVPFTATGAQALPALAGLNTVLTDADSTTVTGRADPIKRIEDLEAAVASIN
jgi:hypothetical protein